MSMIGCFASISPDLIEHFEIDSSAVEEYISTEPEGDNAPYFMDVDKAWHGIHFLLTGQAEGGPPPLALAILGGSEIGDDLGYGPARVLKPLMVRTLATALNAIQENELRSRFDPKAMESAEIYPQGIWVRDNTEALDYLLHYFQQLTAFYRDTAERGHGVLLWLS